MDSSSTIPIIKVKGESSSVKCSEPSFTNSINIEMGATQNSSGSCTAHTSNFQGESKKHKKGCYTSFSLRHAAAVFHFLNHPCTWGRILYQVSIMGLILVSLIFSILATSIYDDELTWEEEFFELGLTIILAMEYFLLMSLCLTIPEYAGFNGLKRFAVRYPQIIDLILLLISILIVLYYFIDGSSAKEDLLVLSFVRLIRVERFTKSFPLIYNVVKKYKLEFIGTFYIGTIIVVLFAILGYYSEHKVNEDISDMPEAIYWSIISLTTVGYGDVTPVSVGGKIVSCFAGIVGMWFFALPAGLLGTAIALQRKENRDKYKEKKEAQDQAALVIQALIRHKLCMDKHCGDDLHFDTITTAMALEKSLENFQKGQSLRKMGKTQREINHELCEKIDSLSIQQYLYFNDIPISAVRRSRSLLNNVKRRASIQTAQPPLNLRSHPSLQVNHTNLRSRSLRDVDNDDRASSLTSYSQAQATGSVP